LPKFFLAETIPAFVCCCHFDYCMAR